MEQRDVVDIGAASSEVLPVSAQQIMKKHENEREQMKQMGPMVPIDGGTSFDLMETPSIAMPIPLRHNLYNQSKLNLLTEVGISVLSKLIRHVVANKR